METQYAITYPMLYARHWWWRSREALIEAEIKSLLRTLQLNRPAKILDFGCGEALFFDRLAQFGEVYGVETDPTFQHPARHSARILREPLTEASFAGMKFDLILALDVIEHLQEDGKALMMLESKLEPHGKILITVPAFQELWDQHDVINKHYRRYDRKALQAVVPLALREEQSFYFFFSLFLPKRLLSFLNRDKGDKAVAQTRIPPTWMNNLLIAFFRIEHEVSRRVRLPFGSSLFSVLGRRNG